MPQKNVVTWNCMISGYIKNGMVSEARRVFDSMPVKNVVSWTAMLSGYAKNGNLAEARLLFDSIEKKNVASWNSMISGYWSCEKSEEAQQLFAEMPVKNDVSWATMVEGYFRCGAVEKAESLFRLASVKSVLLCNAMLAGYVEMGHVDRSYELFTRMPERDVVSWTCLMKGFLRVGELEKARNFFESMPVRDAVAWTVIIKGYLDHDRIETARELFGRMPHKDIVAWNAMLTGFVRSGKLDEAFDLFNRMPHRNVVSWNLMLWGYVQFGDIKAARELFEKIPKKDVISWNTLISGYKTEEALVLFMRMLSNGFAPDQGTLTAVISVSGVLAKLSWGKAMHVFSVRIGHENDNMVASSLISMYSRCGCMKDATLVFEKMQNRDTALWNAMILATARHSFAKQAFDLFRSMIDAGCEPDHVTFLVLLSACAHSGLVSEGLEYFELMGTYKLTPRPKHGSCIVDLLGRSGFLGEAFELINRLPLDIGANAWEALLHACSVHGDYELIDLIEKRILGYQSCHVGMHVLQSNIYSTRGMWKHSARIRENLRQSQLRKEMGWSSVDAN
ncbi:pentatricopeptide repeat-containing protein [Striga asiatica]|uniref:Pentatricopeptide repeat-containing protein n=1 Tax=Striga asiatica TaxID=4170 RepID=A0A5A7QIN1_STRAF|nr:pentatricopeptide repeat-containing protein [Striga asiatica]